MKTTSDTGDMKKQGYRLSVIQIVSLLLIGTGLLLIIITLGLNLYATYDNRKEVQEFKAQYVNETHSDTETPAEEPTALEPISDRIKEDQVIAILRIPVIDCEEVVKEGSERWTLAKALGHMTGTAFPGEIGNCAIAGHRNYNFGLYFNRLNEVQVDDEIMIDTPEATYTYKVTNIKTVLPEEVSVLEPTENATITLLTCTPIYIATHRLVVSGELVDVQYRE